MEIIIRRNGKDSNFAYIKHDNAIIGQIFYDDLTFKLKDVILWKDGEIVFFVEKEYVTIYQ